MLLPRVLIVHSQVLANVRSVQLLTVRGHPHRVTQRCGAVTRLLGWEPGWVPGGLVCRLLGGLLRRVRGWFRSRLLGREQGRVVSVVADLTRMAGG